VVNNALDTGEKKPSESLGGKDQTHFHKGKKDHPLVATRQKRGKAKRPPGETNISITWGGGKGKTNRPVEHRKKRSREALGKGKEDEK